MRRIGLVLSVTLAGCSQGGTAPADGSGRAIACALHGSPGFKDGCIVQQVMVDGRKVLVVRHPDGGFRRFEASADGQSLHTADGAEPGRSTRQGDYHAVIVGADRYLIPVSFDVSGH